MLLRLYNKRRASGEVQCFCITKMNFRPYYLDRKVPRQTNAYVSSKWSLTLPCAYLNTQGSSPSETPLKRIEDD
ncbi:hypothetical protein T07_5848 [Trichinella nelsoni]|uniref:Uncharacterized protein n=1 Tax=Trichinella nelsoni TaxID=6336 RepID=A0A0V0SC26_9BILA|nr:hypothetical protein T07_5848 [Trichinella nelsoni]